MPAAQLLGFPSWAHPNCWTRGWGVQLISHSLPPPVIPTGTILALLAQRGGFLLTLLLHCTFFSDFCRLICSHSCVVTVALRSVQCCKFVLQWGGTHTALPALLVSPSGCEWHLWVWKWGQGQIGVFTLPSHQMFRDHFKGFDYWVKKHAASFFFYIYIYLLLEHYLLVLVYFNHKKRTKHRWHL